MPAKILVGDNTRMFADRVRESNKCFHGLYVGLIPFPHLPRQKWGAGYINRDADYTGVFMIFFSYVVKLTNLMKQNLVSAVGRI